MDRSYGYGHGIDRSRGASGYYGSRIPPPIYTVEEPPRDPRRSDYYKNDYRSSRKPHPETISSASSESDNFTVEDPPDSSARAWLIVLACAVLHACNELTYFMFYNTTVIGPLRNVRLFAGGKNMVSTYTDFQVFEDVRITGEFIAAIASIFIGYRYVAAFGSLCTLGGFLGASFVTDTSANIELMGFLVGFLGGIGCAFWRFAAYVAVMEYFKETRMVALIVSGLGRIIGIFVGYGILAVPLRTVRDVESKIKNIEDMTNWDIYYKCICVPAGVAFFASLTLTPLSLWQDRRRYFTCRQALKMRDWTLCQSGFLWLTLLVYFFYYFGESLPNTTIIGHMMARGFETRFILAGVFTLACGATLGYILLAFWPVNNRYYSTIIVMGCLCLLIGLLTLQLPVFQSYHFSYVGTYLALLGVTQVVFETLLRFVIPIAFSRQYIRLVEGMLGLFGGGAIIAGNFIAKEVGEEGPEYMNNVFYFAGAAFLAAGLISVVAANLMRCLRVKDKNLEKDVPVPREKKHHQRGSRLSESRRRREEYEFGYTR